VSEHDVNGTLLYYASFSGHVESFRAWKFPWVGKPKTQPKILGYALDANNPLYGYVSWNGATEVAAWAIYTSEETARGPWKAVGTIRKQGFETFINFTNLAMRHNRVPTGTGFRPFMYAEALDASGAVLGTSAIAQTFVPDKYTVELYNCSETHCQRCTNMTEQQCDNAKEWFSYDADYSEAWMVERSHRFGYWTLFFLVCVLEVFSLVLPAVLCALQGCQEERMKNTKLSEDDIDKDDYSNGRETAKQDFVAVCWEKVRRVTKWGSITEPRIGNQPYEAQGLLVGRKDTEMSPTIS